MRRFAVRLCSDVQTFATRQRQAPNVTVTVDVDTKALAAKIREILPTEAQKDKETMEQLFSDLRSLMDQPATGESPDQQDQSPTQSVLDAFKPAS